MNSKEKKRTSLIIDKDIHTKLKVHSVKNDIDMSKVVELALIDYFDKIDKEKR